MSRKTFLSTDFFVNATEEEAKKAVSSLPLHLSHITLLKENKLVHSIRFLYEQVERSAQYYVDVSVLPLNDQCVRFNLHCAYTNGQAFHSDPDINKALHDFEQSVHAAVKNDFSSLQKVQMVKPASKRRSYFVNILLSLVLSKYHY